MCPEEFGVFLLVNEIAEAITHNRILRRGAHVPVDEPEIAVLREK
jgi:hypothetical protein